MEKLLKLIVALTMMFMLCGTASVFAADEGFTSDDASGNDPREFSDKFMPYWRTVELDNGFESTQFTLFGFKAFNPRFGMTYEWSIAQEFDYTGMSTPPGPAGPGLDGNVVGSGDLGLRFFLRPRQWESSFMDGEKNISIMPLVELLVPTASDDFIGEDKFIVSPGFVFVMDMPFKSPPLGLGFFAMMNFYDFDAWDEKTEASGYVRTERYRGRWFWMQPLAKPAFVKNPDDTSFHFFDLSGLYLLTEFQPVYDFVTDDFDFWIGPEVGKIIKEGFILYAKPGWGIDKDHDLQDRDFTFEVGMRFFM